MTQLIENQVSRKELRSFGLLVGGVFATTGVWPAIVYGSEYRIWAIVLATLFIVPALVCPKSLVSIHRIWMKLGHGLGRVNTTVLLGVVFFGVVTPAGMIRRMLRKDNMSKRLGTEIQSYRVARKPRPASHLMRQY